MLREKRVLAESCGVVFFQFLLGCYRDTRCGPALQGSLSIPFGMLLFTVRLGSAVLLLPLSIPFGMLHLLCPMVLAGQTVLSIPFGMLHTFPRVFHSGGG